MANIKSAIKRIRVSERKRQRNRPIKSSLKTYVGKARRLIDTGDDTSAAAVVTAISALDKAAAKGIIHKNNAARRKSRLMARLNKAAAK